MCTLAFQLDAIDEDHIYQPRRPVVVTVATTAKPAETCYGCNQDFYEHELCEGCGACHKCCDCPPAQTAATDAVERIDDPEYLCWLADLDRADYEYENWRDSR